MPSTRESSSWASVRATGDSSSIPASGNVRPPARPGSDRLAAVIRGRSIGAFVLLPVLATACASSMGVFPHCSSLETPTAIDTLYFGTQRPGGTVSAEEWERFLAEVVTPQFPNGLTVVRANGQWRGRSGTVERERAYVVHIAHPDSPEHDTEIRAIVDEYKRRFQQEAVMRVRSLTCVSF